MSESVRQWDSEAGHCSQPLQAGPGRGDTRRPHAKAAAQHMRARSGRHASRRTMMAERGVPRMRMGIPMWSIFSCSSQTATRRAKAAEEGSGRAATGARGSADPSGGERWCSACGSVARSGTSPAHQHMVVGPDVRDGGAALAEGGAEGVDGHGQAAGAHAEVGEDPAQWWGERRRGGNGRESLFAFERRLSRGPHGQRRPESCGAACECKWYKDGLQTSY